MIKLLRFFCINICEHIAILAVISELYACKCARMALFGNGNFCTERGGIPDGHGQWVRCNYFQFRQNERPPYWNSISGFDFGYIAAVGVSFCTCLRNFIKVKARQKNDAMSIFKMADLRHLRGPTVGSLKSLCTISYIDHSIAR